MLIRIYTYHLLMLVIVILLVLSTLKIVEAIKIAGNENRLTNT